MFQALLVRKYLFSKVMPLLACTGVLLCVAMVIVIWSVMGGFLDLLIRSGRTTTGDVAISWPNVGFAYYDDLIQRLENDPLIEAAAPIIETYGLIQLPTGRQEMVLVRGVDGPSFAQVTAYDDILWWRPTTQPLRKDTNREDIRLTPEYAQNLATVLQQGRTLTRNDPSTGEPLPAMVMGIEVSRINAREPQGFYSPRMYSVRRPDGTIESRDEFLPYTGEVVLSLLALDKDGAVVEQATRKVPIANEFNSGLFEADSKIVLVRLDLAQRMLRMHAQQRRVKADGTPADTKPAGADEEDEGFIGGAQTKLIDEPARVTSVLVRGKGDLGELGASDPLKDRIFEIYREFAAARKGDVPDEFTISINTWEDQNRTMINAVQKETGLLLFLFSFLCIVAIFLIFAIFWSMIAEKTKDIGIMRALGASKPGVAGVWIGYGLAIGIVGSALGATLAILIVKNINAIHEFLGRAFGLEIWNPEVYYFTEIPTRLDNTKLIAVIIAGILCSVIGAAIPAIRAARMDPVKALRFE
ncbi:MAG: ABC transporter permease [Phycisphaerae bacterium]|jgi:lipoprotein-releasing system permease protein